MSNIQKAKQALELIKGINKTLDELYIKHSIIECGSFAGEFNGITNEEE